MRGKSRGLRGGKRETGGGGCVSAARNAPSRAFSTAARVRAAGSGRGRGWRAGGRWAGRVPSGGAGRGCGPAGVVPAGAAAMLLPSWAVLGGRAAPAAVSAMLAPCWAVLGGRPAWRPAFLLLGPVPLPAGGRQLPFSTTCARCSKNRRLRQKRVISERKLVSPEVNQLLTCSAVTLLGGHLPGTRQKTELTSSLPFPPHSDQIDAFDVRKYFSKIW